MSSSNKISRARSQAAPRDGLIWIGLAAMLMAAALLISSPAAAQSGVRTDDPTMQASPQGGTVPGDSLGSASDTEIWRAVRRGVQGSVSIPDQRAGVLIQSYGENWRNVRNGPLSLYGSWVLLGMLALLALFFLLRGRVKIESGWSGRTIERFNGLERFTHWMTAVSFIVLAITGLNVLYGRYVVAALVGRGPGDIPGTSTIETLHATLSLWGKYAHNFLAFPFMLGVLLMFILWVRHNIPNRYDLIWILKGGGLFSKHSHPPSKKFNAGQKVIFWTVVLTGISLSLSGVALLFPFEVTPWAKTFQMLNVFGLGLPTELTVMQEMQLSQLWHSILAIIVIAVIIAHIYIGSVGMQGAFAAMGSGKVDLNWAKEHHNLWVEEQERKSSAQPAE
ncbi:formate dehydrogenase subunit gamma [Limibacillus halophilus]|jgi:formate dehydrogenase subunit gamma